MLGHAALNRGSSSARDRARRGTRTAVRRDPRPPRPRSRCRCRACRRSVDHAAGHRVGVTAVPRRAPPLRRPRPPRRDRLPREQGAHARRPARLRLEPRARPRRHPPRERHGAPRLLRPPALGRPVPGARGRAGPATAGVASARRSPTAAARRAPRSRSSACGLASPPHRAILLSGRSRVGIGVAGRPPVALRRARRDLRARRRLA